MTKVPITRRAACLYRCPLRYRVKDLLVIVQCERALEVLLTHLAVEPILVLVTLEVFVQQVLPGERLLAGVTGEFVGIHVKRVVPRQVVQPRVLLRTDVTGELGPLRVTPLMVPQVPFLRERFPASAATHLIRFVLFHIHVIGQLVVIRELLLAELTRELPRLLVLLYVLQECRVSHDLVEKGIFEPVVAFPAEIRRVFFLTGFLTQVDSLGFNVIVIDVWFVFARSDTFDGRWSWYGAVVHRICV